MKSALLFSASVSMMLFACGKSSGNKAAPYTAPVTVTPRPVTPGSGPTGVGTYPAGGGVGTSSVQQLNIARVRSFRSDSLSPVGPGGFSGGQPCHSAVTPSGQYFDLRLNNVDVLPGMSGMPMAHCVVELGLTFAPGWSFAVSRVSLGVQAAPDFYETGSFTGTYWTSANANPIIFSENISGNNLRSLTRSFTGNQLQWSACTGSANITLDTLMTLGGGFNNGGFNNGGFNNGGFNNGGFNNGGFNNGGFNNGGFNNGGFNNGGFNQFESTDLACREELPWENQGVSGRGPFWIHEGTPYRFELVWKACQY